MDSAAASHRLNAKYNYLLSAMSDGGQKVQGTTVLIIGGIQISDEFGIASPTMGIAEAPINMLFRVVDDGEINKEQIDFKYLVMGSEG